MLVDSHLEVRIQTLRSEHTVAERDIQRRLLSTTLLVVILVAAVGLRVSKCLVHGRLGSFSCPFAASGASINVGASTEQGGR